MSIRHRMKGLLRAAILGFQFGLYLPTYYRVRYLCCRPFLSENTLAVLVERALFPVVALRTFGADIGGNVRIHRGLYLHEARNTLTNLQIGDNAFLGARVMLDLSDKVIIEANTAVGMNVTIITHSNFGDSARAVDYPSENAPVRICRDAVVNWGCTLNKGTVVSQGCIVLPGAVVAGTLIPGQPIPAIPPDHCRLLRDK